MNILQILPAMDVGGVETGTLDLARHLVRKGHKAVVVSGGGRMVSELESSGARHYELPVGRKSFFSVLKMIDEVAHVIKIEDIDIVHARSRVPAIIAFFAARRTNRTFITTAHGYYKKHLLSEVMGWGKFVIVASNIMAKHMADDFGVPRERLRLIPRGVDLARFKLRAPGSQRGRSFTIGMIARITPLKGHADFIKAIAIVKRSIPNLKALIVGNAPKARYMEELKLLTNRLGLSDVIEFTPSTPDVPALMQRLDLLVLATVTPEAFGRVIIEAQACGVPVVATKVGGVVDILEDSVNGLLCEASNPKDMAAKILKLYNDEGLQLRLSEEGRKGVEADYSLDRMVERTIALYEEAARTKNILVIKISALGDVILSVPSLRAIRSQFPNANVKVLVGLQSKRALDRCPYINDEIVCDLKGRDKGLAGIFRIAGKLQKCSFDMVIDLQNNRQSHILAFLSFAPQRYGYDNGKLSFLLNYRIKDDAPFLGPIDHQFRALKLAGVKPADKYMELWPSPSEDEEAAKILSDNWVKAEQALVGINVRASSRWASKNWPVSYMAELCDRLAKECNIRSVLTGTREDFKAAEKVAKLTKSKPVNAAGRTDILVLASLMKRFRAFLTPDSAPMHVAAAVGTPFVALFGPTDPNRHLPPAKDYVAFYKSTDLKCRPCYSPTCRKNYRCMKKITVNEVFSAIKGFVLGGES